jgi:hypothetical protein
MAALGSLDELKAWDGYRAFVKERLKQLDGREPFYISKERLDFEIKEKAWSGYAVLLGRKSQMAVQQLRKEGFLFREGECTREGDLLKIDGLPRKVLKGANKTLRKLLLGVELEGADEDSPEDEESENATPQAAAAGARGDLALKAERIEKAVQVWKRTEQVATQQLRKLQQAILALNHESAKPVIQGLETILTRLGRVDEEALEAANAARQNDAQGFARARDDLVRKMQTILDYVEKDELIADADQNPAVQVKIRETLGKSLNQLLKAV